jgi:hypothetical protein
MQFYFQSAKKETAKNHYCWTKQLSTDAGCSEAIAPGQVGGISPKCAGG